LLLAIIIFSNQAEYFGFNFFTVGISHVHGEQEAYWNSHQHFGRHIIKHFMEYIHWGIVGNAREGMQRYKALEGKERR